MGGSPSGLPQPEPRRSAFVPLVVVAAAAVAAYLVAALAPLVDVLEPAKLASPFYHYSASDPRRHGLAAGHALLLAAIAAVAGLLAPLALERRDVGVG